MTNNQITNLNQIFYDTLYSGKNPVRYLLHAILSFDQQAKSKPNALFIKPFLLGYQRTHDSLKVLDYGCGWGSFLHKLPHWVKPFCFDLSINAMQLVQSTLALRGRTAYMAQIDDQNNIMPTDFGFIICSHVLEHVPDDGYLLRKFNQALAPDGFLLVNVPINETWYDPKHERAYTIDTLYNTLSGAGFQPVVEWQVDKWTGFLLDRELKPHGVSVPLRWLLRVWRMVLALLPYSLLRVSERILLRHRPFQQLLVIAKKIA